MTGGLTTQAVVFDVGGVLLDWSPYHLYRRMLPDDAAVAAFLDEVGFHEWNVAQDAGGRTWDEAVGSLSSRYPHRAELIAAAHHRWHDMVRSVVAGAAAIMDTLAARGTPLYAVTNFSSEKCRESRDRYGFFRHFRDVVVSGDERVLKPDPAIFHVLLDRNGLAATECLFIDDSPTNVAAAADVGMHALHFTTPDALQRDLQARGLLS